MVRGMYHRSLAGATESCLIGKRALLKPPHGLVLFVSSVAAAAQMLEATMIGGGLYLARPTSARARHIHKGRGGPQRANRRAAGETWCVHN